MIKNPQEFKHAKFNTHIVNSVTGKMINVY